MPESALNPPPGQSVFLPVTDYDLEATLTSGQAFRWSRAGESWEGLIGERWVRLRSGSGGIAAETAEPHSDWDWLRVYLQADVALDRVLATFPDDEPMRRSRAACRGLRLLRQDPWECLASFILSSTKRIVQIQQVVEALCTRFGQRVAVPPGHAPAYAFPRPERLVRASEAELRACKMGFRAPNLLATARMLAEGHADLGGLGEGSLQEARGRLCRFPGVGPKVADCVLLFACGFQAAFPMDVWVMKALQQLYFRGRRPGPARLRQFVTVHFGPHAGYAQQYLFHYARQHQGLLKRPSQA